MRKLTVVQLMWGESGTRQTATMIYFLFNARGTFQGNVLFQISHFQTFLAPSLCKSVSIHFAPPPIIFVGPSKHKASLHAWQDSPGAVRGPKRKF